MFMNPTNELPFGSFIRVNRNHPSTRAGKDGMVTGRYDTGLALIFGWDRHNNWQDCHCIGSEAWELDELDFETVYL